ncbi:hypothetical protein Cch01nite_36130 [Cellulomonas chitinilytica]|uniref:Integral membrane protein n=1 Tax=Cellulomonas chitinilytica TaxID=398759 RepID=A0A919P8J5_9CELL|nr:hypothetical protein [Cellulomonas chitinilytica]GIG22889.1 hypothetical protein Cch01nite_36130 [Cellulomonas chitinilytica]
MSRSRTAPLVVVCALVAVEAIAFLGLGVAFVVDLTRGNATLPAATVFLALFALAVAALLGGASRGLWRGRRWARSPVMTWQILLVVMSLGWLGVEASVWAVAVAVVAVVVAVGLLLPSVVAATTGPAGPDLPTGPHDDGSGPAVDPARSGA